MTGIRLLVIIVCMPQATSYHDLTLDELSNHPVKLGFEFEFASAQSHRRVGEAVRELFGDGSVGVVEDCYNAHRHGGYTKWNVTADSSINPTHAAGYRVELVSPILTPSVLHDTLTKVFAYLRDAHAVTNSSTGMHVTVSHPNVNEEYSSFDPIKMGIFMDDIGMTLKYRGNLNTHYAQSTMALFAQGHREGFNNHRIQARDLNVPWSGDPEILFLLATKEPRIRRVLIEAEKYRSINLSKICNHCVEVRSPGGDYLGAGADEAIETARKILSSLVYACIPDAGFDEYHTRFMSFFESRIKPRPCPQLVNSVDHVTFTVPGYANMHVCVTFRRKALNHEVDGWNLMHNRAVFIHNIKVSAMLPESEATRNGIFSPASSTASRQFDINVQFNSLCAEDSLLDENYEEFLRRHGDVLPVTPQSVSFSSTLVDVNQHTAALELVSAIRTMLGSPAFKQALTSNVTAALQRSILDTGIQRILSFVQVGADAPSILNNDLWTRPLSALNESLQATRRAAERASQIVNQDQFSTKLAARLAALRTAATSSSWTGSAPISAVTSESSANHEDISADGNIWSMVRPMFRNTHFGKRLCDIARGIDGPVEGDPLASPATVLHDTAVALKILLDAPPVMDLLRCLQSSMHVSHRVAQALTRLVANYVQPLSSEYMQGLPVAARSGVIADCFSIAVTVSRLSDYVTHPALGTEAERQAFTSWLTAIKTRVACTLTRLDDIHGVAALVHSPIRLAHAIVNVASEHRMTPMLTLLALETAHVADTILRPTHVGRIRTEIARLTYVAGPDADDGGDEDA